MHTQVTGTQFEIEDTTVVHIPTGAEFLPQAGDSVVGVDRGHRQDAAQRRGLSVRRRARCDENSVA